MTHEALRNRLRKNAKHLRKWARRESVSCFRVYDRDIPEYPLAVDWYDGAVYVAEYAPKRDQEPRSDALIEGWLSAVAEGLGVEPIACFLRQRRRQTGVNQYERVSAAHAVRHVVEDGLRFEVNLSDYLDTGLFLDHRATRAMVREEAQGRVVWNLFCYTGAFSVHAAAGGAKETLSVDMSATYLDWTARNLYANGFGEPAHACLRVDATAWLANVKSEQCDLIVLDPPTFSNSKRMDGHFDVQRDHVALVRHCARALRPGGVLYFSNNLRSFKLDEAAFEGLDAAEITEKTVPPDFRRKRPHRCWRATKP